MNDIEKLFKRISLILDYISDKNNDPKFNPVFLHMKQVLEKGYHEKNMKGLKIVNNDVNEWAKGLSDLYKSELNKILESHQVEKVDDLESKVYKKILKKNLITNDDEYRIINQKVDSLSQENEIDNILIEKLNNFLKEYEKKS